MGRSFAGSRNNLGASDMDTWVQADTASLASPAVCPSRRTHISRNVGEPGDPRSSSSALFANTAVLLNTSIRGGLRRVALKSKRLIGQRPLYFGAVVLGANQRDCNVTLSGRVCLDCRGSSGNVLLRCDETRMVGFLETHEAVFVAQELGRASGHQFFGSVPQEPLPL